jgi:hypothetical protein
MIGFVHHTPMPKALRILAWASPQTTPGNGHPRGANAKGVPDAHHYGSHIIGRFCVSGLRLILRRSHEVHVHLGIGNPDTGLIEMILHGS